MASALSKQDLSDTDKEKNITDVADSLFSSVMSSYDSIFELSFLQTLFDVMGESTVEGRGKRFISNAVSQNVPTILGQGARAIDPVQRRTRSDSPTQSIINSVLAKLPGASKSLPAELDMFGNEVRRNNTDSNISNMFNQFINPATVRSRSYTDDSNVQSMLDVYKSTQDTRATPSAASSSENEAAVGQNQYRALAELLSNQNKRHALQEEIKLANGKTKRRTVNKTWAQMTDEERARVLSRVFGNAKKEMEGDAGD